MNYPELAQELCDLLEEDQAEYKAFVRDKHIGSDETKLEERQSKLNQAFRDRAKRALAILDKIQEPSISNIGNDASLAMSILVSHHSTASTKQVLEAFNACYVRNPNDVRYQSIPAMTDYVAVAEHRSQKFGTIWLMDEQGWPFLPTVRDFDYVNDRRAQYGLEPLRWPKSLAISEEEQPWLKLPLSNSIMREPTEVEYHLNRLG